MLLRVPYSGRPLQYRLRSLGRRTVYEGVGRIQSASSQSAVRPRVNKRAKTFGIRDSRRGTVPESVVRVRRRRTGMLNAAITSTEPSRPHGLGITTATQKVVIVNGSPEVL